MRHTSSSQSVFEQYLRKELSLHDAADALTDIIRQRKDLGGTVDDLALGEPEGMALTEAQLARAEALFAEMNRRAGAA